jgi:hypothetical protein
VKLVVLGHGIDRGDQKIAWLGLDALYFLFFNIYKNRAAVYIIVARKMRLIVVVEYTDIVGAFRDDRKISNAILMT